MQQQTLSAQAEQCTGAMEGSGDVQGLRNQAAINTAFPEADLQPHWTRLVKVRDKI